VGREHGQVSRPISLVRLIARGDRAGDGDVVRYPLSLRKVEASGPKADLATGWRGWRALCLVFAAGGQAPAPARGTIIGSRPQRTLNGAHWPRTNPASPNFPR